MSNLFLRLAQLSESDALQNLFWDGNPPAGGPSPLPIDGGVSSARQNIVQIAKSQIGQGGDGTWKNMYTSGVVDQIPTSKISWCGIFALWVLHQAGIATDTKWEYGSGFLSKLPQTKDPKPGDLAYLDKNQHHAIIERIDGNTVYSIDGNSVGGVVAARSRPKNAFRAFFSIDPLIGEVER
jgi:hypothetical protein